MGALTHPHIVGAQAVHLYIIMADPVLRILELGPSAPLGLLYPLLTLVVHPEYSLPGALQAPSYLPAAYQTLSAPPTFTYPISDWLTRTRKWSALPARRVLREPPCWEGQRGQRNYGTPILFIFTFYQR